MDLGSLDRTLREKSKEAVAWSFDRWRKRDESAASSGTSITFLGTGGNPEASFTQQPRTGGFLLEAGGIRLYVDPGPGAVVYARQMAIDLGALDAVYVSHGHLDHYAGAESAVEAMCWAMYARRGYLLAPNNVLQGEQLVSRYHQGANAHGGYKGGPEVISLEADKPVLLKNALLRPVRAHHTRDNYGFVLDTGNLSIGYTSDTNYIRTYSTPEGIKEVLRGSGPLMDFIEVADYRKDIKEVFSKVDVLVANVTSHNLWANRHLTTLGLPHLLKGSRVKLCFITHFNHCCVQPEDLRPLMAQFVQEKSGVKTIAAYDGAVHDLELLLAGLGVK
ncbi:MBL fold metallo-hydrolase [Desulfofalx alkaliphila]|uniref:MBL fold metallo-hydrolase n=1 Tax=Desulfofalx alkaliphila TaxID=105483 RepID=UPI0004E11120|nr:MBL fold metallo-hydrolase [Desulfofalx alkaliphila]